MYLVNLKNRFFFLLPSIFFLRILLLSQFYICVFIDIRITYLDYEIYRPSDVGELTILNEFMVDLYYMICIDHSSIIYKSKHP